jgi:hypothetical protein
MIQQAVDDPDDHDGSFECPRCHSQEFGTWAFPHPLILHWVLNPGLIVNELILGQRIPKITYYCKQCGSDTTYVRYYQCPSCDHFHEEAIWTGANGFGHWLGMICPDCGTEIPCLLNIASWIVLARLSPINWTLRRLVGNRYLQWEQRRAQRSRAELNSLAEPVGDPGDGLQPADLLSQRNDLPAS